MNRIAKQLILISILAMGITTASQAQAVFPVEADNQIWEYVTWNFWGGHCQLDYITTGEEVDLCGEVFTPVYNCYLSLDDCSLLGYYRVEGEQVMVRDLQPYWNGTTWVDSVDCDRSERLMYDFSLTEYDTVYCGIQYPQSQTKFWKTGEAYIEYEVVERKTMDMSYFPYPNFEEVTFDMKWIEGVGSNVHPFYSLTCIGDHCEQEQQLTRVTRDDVVIYLDTILSFSFPCTHWLTDTEHQVSEEVQVSVYPNPASDRLTIDFNRKTNVGNTKIILYDMLGKELSMEYIDDTKDTISLEGLPAGIYYVSISLNGQIFIKKVVLRGKG